MAPATAVPHLAYEVIALPTKSIWTAPQSPPQIIGQRRATYAFEPGACGAEGLSKPVVAARPLSVRKSRRRSAVHLGCRRLRIAYLRLSPSVPN